MSEDFKSLQPWMRPFPAVKDIFAADVAKHAEHLQPVLSIDAVHVDPDWQGLMHFILPREPYEGLLGEQGAAYYQGYCQLNWIAFQREADGRYRFLGDWRYFHMEQGGDSSLAQHYADTEKSLTQTKQFFEQHGFLNPWNQTDNPVEWIEDIGGIATDGNWTAWDFPVEQEQDPNDEYQSYAYPLTHDGRRFRYVGCLQGFCYRENAPDGVLLFYDPAEEIILTTFDWT
jgi:hypothetical protein